MKTKKSSIFLLSVILALVGIMMVPLSMQNHTILAANLNPADIIDDFEDGNSSDWSFFGGNAAGGGGGVFDDRPKDGTYYFSTGWGGDGTGSGFYGGTFKNFNDAAQVTPPADPWFNVWVLNQSNATVNQYTLEITVREDLDGNGWTTGSEDSLQLNTTFASAEFDDQWHLVSAPLSSFSDLATGGNGTFDGNLDEIVVVISGVQGAAGSTVEVDFDLFTFSSGGPLHPADFEIVDDFESGLPSSTDVNGNPIGFFTFSDGSPISIATTDTPPAPVPGSTAGNNVLALTGNVTAFAGFVHAFENTAVDTWVPQDWSSFEGLSLWIYGHGTGTTLFVDVIDNRSPGSTTDDGERFTVSLVDDFNGWQFMEFPFSNFVRKDIGNGAPNDGFTLTQVHGWALGTLNTGGEITYYVDDAALYGVAEIPELAVTFDSANYDVDEGSTGNIVVKLNRPMNSEDPAQVSVDFHTEPGSATPDRDYTPTAGTLTFVNGGPVELSFPLETSDDTKWEGTESVILRLSNLVDVNAGFSLQAGASIIDNDPYDPNLLDDFEDGVYLWDSNGIITLETAEIEAGDPNAIPGQDPFETVLQAAPISGASALSVIENAKSDLDALRPSGNRITDLWLKWASYRLKRSMYSTYWENDYYLNAKKGSGAFSNLKIAVFDLSIASARPGAPSAAIQLIMDDLINAAANLAQTEINLAVASNGDSRHINRALSEIDKAVEDLANGKPLKATAHYRNAWIRASRALKKTDIASASIGRDFALGQDWTHGEALTFWYHGSNSGEDVTVYLKDNRAPDPGPAGWGLVWSEEFNEPAGTPPNPAYWSYEIGDGTINGIPGWGNDEFQYYTDDPANAATDGAGNMVLTVEEADGSLLCYYGPCDYTSARLISSRKAEFSYGRIESRIRVPEGEDGLWPAFWSLGTDIDVVGWPQTGEIDFMEYVSRLPNEIFGTIHGPGYSGGQSFGNVYDFGAPVYNNYHTFAIEWQPDLIEWYVDGILYHTAASADVSPNEWVFNDPVFLLLNIAIGGNFGGNIDPNLQLPQSMAVDYIRVYQGPDTAERFDAAFSDDFNGWQQVEIPFTSFSRSAEQPDGAPDDGLGLTEMWGYGFELPAYSDQYALWLDQVRVKQVPPPTEVIVTTLANDGPGSLREALQIVAPDGMITFDSSLAIGTIALTTGQLTIDKNVTIDGSGAPGLTVSGNNASRVLQIEPAAAANINDLNIADGAGAPQGGGILNFGVLNLDFVSIINNQESSAGATDFQFGGGGIYNGDGATLNLTNSSVNNNSTLGQPGGGIYGFFNSTINVTNSTVSGNVAGDVAGGLRTLGNVTITNSTISGNTSSAWHGGAMFSTDGSVTILNSTIVANNAPAGTAGGLMVATFGAPVDVTVQNSIIADNGSYNCQVEGSPAVAVLTSLGNNVVTDGSCAPVASDNNVGAGGAFIDVLADNGGPTKTHALLAGSPAIDAANGAACPATDQRGVARPQGAGCDVGSFEVE